MQGYLPFIIEGILLGLGLAVMVGPIFVALTETSIEKGGRAGMVVGAGIWISDVLFIAGTYFFINRIESIIQDHAFQYWMGLLGGFVLMSIGLGTMLKKVEFSIKTGRVSASGYLGLWTKGFLVNTVNPFTFVFWFSVMSTYLIGKDVTSYQAAVFFSTILLVIILTDAAKVILAKTIRKKLNTYRLKWAIRTAGFILFIFGIILIVRVS